MLLRSSPPKGTEANFLRAQIARIAATTVCSPAGCFNANEEGGLDKNEEWEGVPGKDAAQPSAWTHRSGPWGGGISWVEVGGDHDETHGDSITTSINRMPSLSSSGFFSGMIDQSSLS